MVLVVAFVALRHPKHAATAAGTDTRTSTPPPVTQSPSASSASSPSRSSSSPSGSQPLVVLNDTGTDGVGHEAARRFRQGGWRVTTVDEHYSNNILSTVAYYDPATPGAERAAHALQEQFPAIKRVTERFPQLPAGPIVVVLTTDYTSS